MMTLTTFAPNETVRFYYNGKLRVGKVERMVNTGTVTLAMLNENGKPVGGYKSFKLKKMEKTT